MGLRTVHHVDVLREEDDLADRPLQLRCIVRRELRLGLADSADHREDVVSSGARSLRLLELVLGDEADDVLVDLPGRQSTVSAGLDDATVPSREPLAEFRVGLADAPSELVVELHRQIGDQLVRQIGGDVLLLASHDAHRDDGVACLGVERLVGRGEPRGVELLHQLGAGLLARGPPQEAPDRVEVLDVVDQRACR